MVKITEAGAFFVYIKSKKNKKFKKLAYDSKFFVYIREE